MEFVKQQNNSSPILFSWATSVLSLQQAQAFLQLQSFSARIPALSALFTTPQTPPWHGEGLTVADHLARMMAALELVCHDPQFLRLDVWQDHDLQLFIRDVQATCVRHKDLLLAFILTHDLAKAETVVLQGVSGSVGEREGFLGQHVVTMPERERYLKLARAVSLSKNDSATLARQAFVQLNVHAHYPLHDRLGASAHYGEVRLAILRELTLDDSYARFLSTLIRLHIDALSAWTDQLDVRRLQAFDAIARHAGINVELFHDVLPACLLLDGVLGILQVRDGGFVVDASVIRHYFLSEREAFPQRHEKRLAGEKRVIRERVQGILERHDLSPVVLFRLLQTPVGPQRGEVMHEVYHALREEGYVPQLGAQTETLLPRIARARAEIIQEELPFL
ncbi:hypothetical protein KBC55_03840 [Patescibacteria group bacterium]|nr:hypothetical protein [Patescibacteria group bacterium]